MASGGGLGRFARGKPHGNEAVPATASGGSTFQDPESVWMAFHDETTSEFGFGEFNIRDHAAQEFDFQEESSRHDTSLVGLQLFKSPPTNAQSGENRKSHNESKDEDLDTFHGAACMEPEPAGASAIDGDSTPSRDNGPSGSLATLVHSETCTESSDTNRQKLSGIDDSMDIEMDDSIDASVGCSVGLLGGESAVASCRVHTLPKLSIQGAKTSVANQETSNSSRSSSDSITNAKPWYDVTQLLVTANESTRVIPIPRSVEKRPTGNPVERFKHQATTHIFTPPGQIVRKATASHIASEPAAHNPQGPSSTQLATGSHKNHSTPGECHDHSERSVSSTIPVVTPGEASATHSRKGPFVSEGRDNHSVSASDKGSNYAQRGRPRNITSQNGAPLDQGLDFEELHAKFLSDIRDLEDLQDGNTSRLLVMQGMFATSYAESLKDQAMLIDLLRNLEKVTATAQETIARFHAGSE